MGLTDVWVISCQRNAISEFDAYLMLQVNDLPDHLSKACFITALDLTKGYWRIPLISEGKKSTFSNPLGLLQFVTMPFGLHGGPGFLSKADG